MAKILGLGKGSLTGARRESNVSSVKKAKKTITISFSESLLVYFEDNVCLSIVLCNIMLKTYLNLKKRYLKTNLFGFSK